MAANPSFQTSARCGSLVAAVASMFLAMPSARAQSAQLTASAISTLYNYNITYTGTNFPRGAIVQLRISDAGGSLPLGSATAGLDGSFQGMASVHCMPPGYTARQQATLSAVQGTNGMPLATASLSFACLLQH